MHWERRFQVRGCRYLRITFLFYYSQRKMFNVIMPEWMEMEFETTFYSDFTIAERISWIKGIKDTYKRAFENWKDSVKYFTELVVALNWKIWYRHGKNDEVAKLYDELWKEADWYAVEHFKGDDLSYFYRQTD